VDIHSNMVVYPIDPRSCQIILEGSITARVFGIGSIIENAYITGIKETYNRLPLVVTTWKSTKLIGTIRPLTQEDSIKEEEFFAGKIAIHFFFLFQTNNMKELKKQILFSSITISWI